MLPEETTTVESAAVEPTEIVIPPDTVEGSAPIVADSPVVVSEEAPEFNLEAFDWNAWDGKEEPFPENIRPYIIKTSDFWRARLEELRKDSKNIDDLSKLLFEEENKVVVDTEEVIKLREEVKQAQEQANQHKQQLEEFQKVQAELEEKEAVVWIEKLKKDNADVFNSEPKAETVRVLISEENDFEIEDAIVLARKSKIIVEKAIEYRKQGTPSNLATEFAMKGSTAIAAPGSASLVEGAEKVISGTPPEHLTTSKLNPATAREQAAERALKVHSR